MKRLRSGPFLRLALPTLVAVSCHSATSRGEPAGERDRAAGRTEDVGSIEAFRRDLATTGGPLSFAWDEGGGRLYAEVPLDRQLIYVVSLSAGLGSNDVGLDRGQLGEQKLIEFRDHGEKVLVVAPNLDWRSSSADPVERAAVRDAFAESVLFGFEPVARTGERVLVDLTDWLLRDAHGIAGALERSGQGSFTLERSRSVLLGESVRGFPANGDVEGLYTYVAKDPGREVRATAADPRSVTFRVRHSFVELPELDEARFRPRRFDPRSGYYPHGWHDLASPLDEPLERQVITRHRLTAEEPIVYYVDRGAPEPVRTALLEGARYWQPAFAAAGFPNGFRVELLPEDADPYDIRYNVIQWVNRSTRGWSYGSTVNDPRTGEILKGHVTLGALRVRQDILLFEGLTSPYRDGVDHAPAVIEAALARIRQLSAHEVGHTLGLTHNFAASADGRESVMDYPAPLVTLDANGRVDLSDAYRDGAGAWDERAIRYGYAAFPAEVEEAALQDFLAENRVLGLRFVSDEDSRGLDRAHPDGNLWDNGPDPVLALRNAYAVRAAALERFGVAAIRPGRPLFDLERTLLPLYLHHRYQLEAAVRQIGGVQYEYAVRGEGGTPAVEPVPGDRQRTALTAALVSVSPEFLELPPELLSLLPPPPPGSSRDRESLDRGSLPFDPLRAAATAAWLTVDMLLDPARLTRVVDQARRDPTQLSFEQLMRQLVDPLWAPEGSLADEQRALLDQVRTATLKRVFELASDPSVPTRVQGRLLAGLRQLETSLESSEPTAQSIWERERLRRFFGDPESARIELRPYRVPPGSPIGCGVR